MKSNHQIRAFHVIPGRLRVELFGLRDNPDVALRFKQVFSSIDGILHLETNIVTGKILLQYDEQVLSSNQLCFYISQFEEMLFQSIIPRELRKKLNKIIV